MIKVKGSEPLFDAFTAESLNISQSLRFMSTIVQNDGVELTTREVEAWAEEATHELLKAHRRQLSLITNTLKALQNMGEPEQPKVLGYSKSGLEIHELPLSLFTTAAMITCCGCGAVIRAMGGPMRGAVCPTCWEEK